MDPIIDVVVETTQGSKHKYEYDHQLRAMRLDRRLYSAVSFPADYGFVAGTEGADGEPLDALVLLEDATFPGCWVRARVVGVFWIRYDKEGESRREAKLITVAEGDPNFDRVGRGFAQRRNGGDSRELGRSSWASWRDTKVAQPGPQADPRSQAQASLTEVASGWWCRPAGSRPTYP